jgi:hypothetical protein
MPARNRAAAAVDSSADIRKALFNLLSVSELILICISWCSLYYQSAVEVDDLQYQRWCVIHCTKFRAPGARLSASNC